MAMIKGTQTYWSETIKGTVGDDSIDGMGGIDIIDGGSGIDTVLYFDSKNNFTLTTLTGTTRIKASSSADSKYEDLESVLTNVEKIQFTDGIVNLGTAQPIVEEQPLPIYIQPVVTNSTPTGNISISGAAQQDETLFANADSLVDQDGLGRLNYQWLQNGKAISGATSNNYTLTESDIGKAIKVKVSYTDGVGFAENVTSGATEIVQPLPEPEVLTPTYQLTVDKTNVNESGTVTFKLTTNVTEGSKIPFKLSGTISDADALNGLPVPNFYVEADGSATVAIGFKNDKLTEGAEKLTVTLSDDASQTVTVTVKDECVAPKAPPITPPVVVPPTNSTNETQLNTNNPYFVGKNSDADNVRGSVIDDDMQGNIGNDHDQILGEDGDDSLKGGAGNDSINGGADWRFFLNNVKDFVIWITF